jgi:hypothetical protein
MSNLLELVDSLFGDLGSVLGSDVEELIGSSVSLDVGSRQLDSDTY